MQFEPYDTASNEHESADSGGKVSQSTMLKSVVVRGFSDNVLDQLELIFENEARSGGGPLVCPVEFDSECLQAMITFQSAESE